MPLLEAPAIRDQMRTIPSWSLQNRLIHRTYEFPDFLAAMAFVNAVASLAEDAQHHPDIDIRWDKVSLALTTHDEGGLTARDFDLARRADAAAGG